jgi:hypothetical protein
VVLISIDPPVAINPTAPRINVELWRATPQKEVRKVWSADWTLKATPFYILLADLFKGKVPDDYGDNDRVYIDVVSLREDIVES